MRFAKLVDLIHDPGVGFLSAHGFINPGWHKLAQSVINGAIKSEFAKISICD